MGKRSRIVAFGTAAAFVVGGVVSAIVLGGGTGQLLALLLIGLGFVFATSLVFLEVGLSEDRALAKEEERKPRRRVLPRARPRRLDRMRGQHRRLP